MAAYRIAAVINPPSGDDFLVVRQVPPPALPEEEYQQYVDSDLWDLPSAPLKPREGGESRPVPIIGDIDLLSGKLDLASFDVGSSLDEVMSQVGLTTATVDSWVILRYIEEADFGPAPFVHTILILGRLKCKEDTSQESRKWISRDIALKLLDEVKPGNERIGPFVGFELVGDSAESRKWRALLTLQFQEYPPGITVVPMRSRTLAPFRTTNLVVVAPDNICDESKDSNYFAYGDALLMDPGCLAEYNAELANIVAALPRKLIVFVTHHHNDHVDGLSVVQKCNPDAILLAHENTMNRIGKDIWSGRSTVISGGEKICIGGQLLEVISSPGHTDGHLALLHFETNSLVVGDHCVGQGSSVLDIKGGGNMKDYFQTTYKFLELSPHLIISMHGRINLWPKHMLSGYLKNRRERESSILKAIENGAETLFDVVSKVYHDVDIKFWIPASSNVKLHVDHLAYQKKLPKDFSMIKFHKSYGVNFVTRWVWAYLKMSKLGGIKMLAVLGIAGFAWGSHWKSSATVMMISLTKLVVVVMMMMLLLRRRSN